jgi:import receptor subunit TOM70
MNPPKNEEAVKDCDAALRLDPSYLKALNRRAAATESLGRYDDALRGMRICSDALGSNANIPSLDYTASTILGRFQNESTAQAVERVLKKLSTEKANEILSVCLFYESPVCSPLNINHP